MANAIYPKFKEALLKGLSNVDLTSGTIKVTLVDTTGTGVHVQLDFRLPLAGENDRSIRRFEGSVLDVYTLQRELWLLILCHDDGSFRLFAYNR